MTRAFLCATLSLGLLFGCNTSPAGDDDDDDSSPNRSANVDDDPATVDGLVRSICGATVACCDAAGLGTDPTRCILLFDSSVSGLRYVPSAGKACVEAIRRITQDYSVCAESSALPAECGAALQSKGTKNPGETCSSSEECANSAYGDVTCASGYSGGMTIMKCQAQAAGVLGSAPCVATQRGDGAYFIAPSADVPPVGYVCNSAQGNYCDGTACAAIGGAGAPCLSEEACDESSFCDYNTQACAPRIAVGGSCPMFSDRCVSGAYCETLTSLCTAALGAGAACTQSSSCRSEMCVNGACVGDEPVDLGLALICGS